jgi:hypothetical protein
VEVFTIKICHMPIVPATLQAEAGGLLEPKSSGQFSETLSHKEKK